MIIISILFVFGIAIFLGWYFTALSDQMFEEDEVVYCRTTSQRKHVPLGVTYIDRYKVSDRQKSKSA